MTASELYDIVGKNGICKRAVEMSAFIVDREERRAAFDGAVFDIRWIVLVGYMAGKIDGIRQERARKQKL